ncbi:GFA family protein [Psychrobacter alimentarius]|uniref:GFA family protein n=1 Tax=Psychrobacter alimentarius TaxID=261164 RepID=UPI001D105603|nr:GFA family protein [Psychrobacter alimentarius]
MKGECLCGNVKFEISEKIRNFYQCHCSLCRKATGASSNTATFVQDKAFRWISGESDIKSYKKPSGYRSDFCSVCGSLVPNSLRDSGMVWVPAGLLNEPVASKVSVHLHIESAATWEQDAVECVRLDGGPESLEALNNLL